MTPREEAEAAVERARSMPHILELDGVERDYLADLLQREADRLAKLRRTESLQLRRFVLGLRERIRLPYSQDRAGMDLTRDAGDMDSSDGFGR